VHAIDTGAVWSGKLTALQLDAEDLHIVQVPGRDVSAPPPKQRGYKHRPAAGPRRHDGTPPQDGQSRS
jgi:bis(5'-nucleosyl)-tetraphosphatase (symmetrical)